jgi:hypothetical protein
VGIGCNLPELFFRVSVLIVGSICFRPQEIKNNRLALASLLSCKLNALRRISKKHHVKKDTKTGNNANVSSRPPFVCEACILLAPSAPREDSER